MSTERGGGLSGRKAETQRTNPTEPSSPGPQPTTPRLADEQDAAETERRRPAAKRDQASESTSPSTPDDPGRPRQVIAVSASKGPAAFFNLARKFLVTDEMCDLSALEGAIVSAVDAAHLLERSKLATIVRVQTSYVSVEPKRRKSQQHPSVSPVQEQTPSTPQGDSSVSSPRGRPSGSGRELRRARIVITVKRTESYKQWLQENPLQAIIAGDGGEEEDDDDEAAAEEEAHRR